MGKDLAKDLSNLSEEDFEGFDLGEVDEIDDDLLIDAEDDSLFSEDLDLDIEDDGLELDEDFSLIDTQLDNMNENNDQASKLAMLMGLDIETGNKSRGLVNDLTKYTMGVEVEEEEGDLDELIQVPKTFDSSELDRLKNMLSGIIQFHSNREIDKKAKEIEKQLTENNNIRNIANRAKLDIEEESKEIKQTLNYIRTIFGIYVRKHKGEKLSKKEELIIAPYNINDVKNEYYEKEKALRNLTHKLNQLITKINKCDEIENEIIEEIKKLNKVNKAESAKNASVVTDEILNNMSKVIKVQFGGDMYSEEFRETKVAVMCSCNNIEIFDYSQLPYYFSGDIYKNFKERSYTNSNVTKNYYSVRGKVKQTETRTKLHREEDIIERRIEFPGITDKSVEAMKCSKCNKYMFFTPDVVDKLVDKGFLIDEFTAELANSGYGKNYDITQGVKVYLHENEVNRKYKGDLGLAEYKKAKISSNIEDLDKYETVQLGKTVKMDERALREYANISSNVEVDLKQIEEDFLNHVSNIRVAIKEIRTNMKPRKEKEGMNKAQLAKVKTFNRQRKQTLEFLQTHEGLIIKYAIDKKVSAHSLKNIIKDNIKSLQEFKDTLYEFLVEFLVDTVIKRKSTFVFEHGSARSISNKEIILPHNNFFDCYKPLIKEFFLTEVRSIKRDIDLMKYYDIFKQLSAISKISGDDELKIKKSEEFVRDFRKALGTSYELGKSKLFMDYISDRTKLESNFDLNGKCFAWLYYEMITQNKAINNTEVQDTDLFTEIYGEELESQGNFFPFQINK